MAVPSEIFDPLLVAEIDTKSPVSPGVMEKIRASLIHLFEVLYGDAFTAAVAHDHDGINSASIAAIASSFIFFASPTQIVNSTTTGSYVNVDITPEVTVGHVAKIAMLQVFVDFAEVSVPTNTVGDYGAFTRFREAGSVLDTEQNVSLGFAHEHRTETGGSPTVTGEYKGLIFVELDSNEQYEWQTTENAFNALAFMTTTTQQHLIAYIR